MRCEKCGGELRYNNDDIEVDFYQCDKCNSVYYIKDISDIAEKAESELKAIRDRIEAVTEDEILEIIEEQDEKYIYFITADKYIAKAIIEKIKQIGGVK